MPMRRKSRGKSGQRKPARVISLTPSEAFEEGLSSSSDAVCIRGKVLLSSAVTTTPTALIQLNSGAFGARCTNLTGIFTRYRIKYVRFKVFAQGGLTTTGGIAAVGVLDDATTTEGDSPANVSDVAELRCSATNFPGQTTPTEFVWRPVDGRLWYATTGGVSGSDARLVDSGVLYGAQSGSNTVAVNIEMDWCLVFKGATDTGGS